MVTRTPKPHKERPIPDQTPMKVALADAITQWAGLEDSMAYLLNMVVRGPLSYGMMIYFTPSATETRFSIVDVATSAYLLHEPRLWDFLPLWQKTLSLLNKAKSVRNKLAHGSVIDFAKGRVREVRLVDPMFKTPLASPNGQLPGMSLNDVKQAFDQFWFCGSAVNQLSQTIESLHTGHLTVEALHERCLELRAHLRMPPAHEASQTPEEPSAPPLPSEEKPS